MNNRLVTIFSDLHIHNYRKFDVDNSRLNNCLSVFEDVFKYNDKNGITCSLFCGDLYNNQKMLPIVVLTDTIAKLLVLFEEYPKQCILAITGNHDQATKNLLDNPSVSALKHLALIFPKRFILLDDKSIKVGNCVVSGIPYYEYPEHFKHRLEDMASKNLVYKENGLSTILLMHQTPTGLGNTNIPVDTDVNDKLYDAFDYVFDGHIHERQLITDKFLVVGSPIHRDLGDEGQDKGFIVMDLENLGKGFKYISLKGKYPEFVRAEVDSTGELPIDGNNYVVPVIKSDDVLMSADDDVSADDFGSDLKAETLLKNYWEEVDGKDKKLLSKGLKLIE